MVVGAHNRRSKRLPELTAKPAAGRTRAATGALRPGHEARTYTDTHSAGVLVYVSHVRVHSPLTLHAHRCSSHARMHLQAACSYGHLCAPPES